MVIVLLVPIRKKFNLKKIITKRHIDKCAQLMFITALLIQLCYLLEFFLVWYSGEKSRNLHVHGPYVWGKSMDFLECDGMQCSIPACSLEQESAEEMKRSCS